MLLGIDDVVIAVDDPDATAAAIEKDLGLRVAAGGRHDALGTFNRLVWLGDSYLELIGVFDRELAEAGWLGGPVLDALERGGGLATWAVAVDDVEAQLRWASEDGGLAGPIYGERRRDDGSVVRWRLARAAAMSPTVPFVIEHDADGAEWTPAEREARATQQHPLGGGVRLASLNIATASPASAAATLRALLATSVEPGGRGAVRVPIGIQAVRFAVPRADTDPPTTIELVTDARTRRRARIGDVEIRIRGGSGTHRDVREAV